jgi:hypothetical protein
MSLKIFNSSNTRTRLQFLAESLTYAADNGADVISISLGWILWPVPQYYIDAIDYVYNKGVVMVASAGNSNRTDPYHMPAGSVEVISVAATNQNDERTTEEDWDPNHIVNGMQGSNFGFLIDVAAPGNLAYSTMPTFHVGMNDDVDSSRGENWVQNYDYFRGTSCAAPIVAGIAGLILSKNPSYSPEEVRLIIRANTDPYISEEYIGTGRVNAYKALMELNTQPNIPETPLGPTSGRIKREQTFTSSATDQDGDDLWYFWDWGDENNSGWLGPYSSGDTCEASYTWQLEGNFSVRVKVKDGNGGESYWSDSLPISMPKYKFLSNLLLERLLSRFPILEFLI